jgi:hypothetical protein
LTAIRALRPALVGAVNGRFLNIKSDALALSTQPTFAQFQEGLRLKPSLFDGRLRLNYLVDFQQFAASSDSHASFHRWTLDLKHEVPFYRTVSSTGPKDFNGPDSCSQSVGSRRCRTRAILKDRPASVCSQPNHPAMPAARCRSTSSRRWAALTSTASVS